MANMTARMRRLVSDWEQIKNDFGNHKYIMITPLGREPYEKYHVTYFVKGIYLQNDNIVTLNRHEVEIILHAEYPRYKPKCEIMTPIYHPNFRDGQICIGDIWGAGESLSDIIINIGDMIQYKSWNSFSPLSAEAAQWALEHIDMFPVGNINLNVSEEMSACNSAEVELNDPDNISNDHDMNTSEQSANVIKGGAKEAQDEPVNDFEITADELKGITYTSTAQRMQAIPRVAYTERKSINFKTVVTKGIVWALIGAILGFALNESLYDGVAGIGSKSISIILGTDSTLVIYPIAVGLWTCLFTACVGLFLGIGEGVYYGSTPSAIKYALIGMSVSLGMGFFAGMFNQIIYSALIGTTSSELGRMLARGVAWCLFGCGIGLSTGLIKPERKRIAYCVLGGGCGAFLGGFVFDLIYRLGYSNSVCRGIGLLLTGLFIGIGIGLLEQASKQAWLKVIRGEFEGKEYLVFSGTTSIGNNGQNVIVLFKDKLVAPHQCDIVQNGDQYIIVDAGTPMGTFVNGMKISKHNLKNGDVIAMGNSVLLFNTK